MTTPTVPPPPPKPAPPPPPKPPSNGVRAPSTPTSRRTFGVSSGKCSQFQKTILFGPGGIGKSELCANMKQLGLNPLFLDIGDGTRSLDVDRVDGLLTWQDMRDALHNDDLWRGRDAVILDDLTRAEELGSKWVVENVKAEKGREVKNIEDFGYGKGYSHIYDQMLLLLGDLDMHVRSGRQVVCIAHECTVSPENPEGENYSQYQPRLQSPPSGKNSVRYRVKEWADHVLFINYDVAVNEDGKGIGGGTRTIYPTQLPAYWAKSRTLSDPIPYERGSAELWKQLFNK